MPKGEMPEEQKQWRDVVLITSIKSIIFMILAIVFRPGFFGLMFVLLGSDFICWLISNARSTGKDGRQ